MRTGIRSGDFADCGLGASEDQAPRRLFKFLSEDQNRQKGVRNAKQAILPSRHQKKKKRKNSRSVHKAQRKAQTTSKAATRTTSGALQRFSAELWFWQSKETNWHRLQEIPVRNSGSPISLMLASSVKNRCRTLDHPTNFYFLSQ